jgi:hypothetical protein
VEFEEELQVFKQRACVWFWGLNDSQGVEGRNRRRSGGSDLLFEAAAGGCRDGSWLGESSRY